MYILTAIPILISENLHLYLGQQFTVFDAIYISANHMLNVTDKYLKSEAATVSYGLRCHKGANIPFEATEFLFFLKVVTFYCDHRLAHFVLPRKNILIGKGYSRSEISKKTGITLYRVG